METIVELLSDTVINPLAPHLHVLTEGILVEKSKLYQVIAIAHYGGQKIKSFYQPMLHSLVSCNTTTTIVIC